MPSEPTITFADIVRYQAAGGVPLDPRFSADGRFITFRLMGAGEQLDLWAHEVASGRQWRLLGAGDGAGALSREELLRQERQRQFGGGVQGHAWSREGDTLLIRQAGRTFARPGVEGEDIPLGQGGPCIDPQLNRAGTAIAFVRDGDLYTQTVEHGSAPRRLTYDAAPADAYGDRALTNGLAEFVAQEEMGRSAGFWWSYDGERIAFEQVDSAPVPHFLITHPGAKGVDVEAHRYPFAGANNARVRLGVISLNADDITWLSFAVEPDDYLARAQWTPDGCLLIQAESRDQRRLAVRRIDPGTGAVTTLWTDRVEPWINLHDDLRVVQRQGAAADDYHLLWSSERTGWRAVELRDRDGALVRTLDQRWEGAANGRLFIDGVVGVDAERGVVYVAGWAATPLERQVFRLALDGGPPQPVTREPGSHGAALSPDGSCLIDVFSSVSQPPTVTLRRVNGETLASLAPEGATRPDWDKLALHPPEFITVSAEDGVTLHGAVYRPRGLAPGERAPVIVDVYGGPHVQQVVNAWGVTADLRAQRFAQAGFIVLVLDNRGSARRGLAFEGAIAGNLGQIEVRDQVAGVRALARYPEADRSRVGVYGWSYGGYLALMLLARAPDVFHAAVAGAPVTHWDGYDTHYTERYMGDPRRDPGAYERASVLAYASGIRGKLLIIHGMVDENVHFRHTGRLIHTLNRHGVPYETWFLPEERHRPRREADRIQLERRVAAFLEGALRPSGSDGRDQ